MRNTTLLLCLALAGCAGANAAHNMTAGSPDPGAATGRNANASAKKDEQKTEWWKEGGVTREKINAMCWMKYEQGRKDIPIDKRADLVNACVADALREHPL